MNQQRVQLNSQIRLAKYPTSRYPQINQDIFQMKVVAPRPTDSIQKGQIIVRNLYIGMMASMRIYVTGFDTYVPGVKKDDVMFARAVGQVIYSNGNIPVGTLVAGLFGWQKYAVAKQKQVQIIPKGYDHPQYYLSVFGPQGLAAYIGLFKIGKIKSGDLVVISAAAGATGSIAVQLAKFHGCQVCAIVGSDKKCEFVKSIGADTAINYKKAPVEQQLKKLYPKGVDVYFDNVGGQMLDALLMNIKQGSKIVLCGSISTYHETGLKQSYKLKNYPRLIIKKCTMEGFIFFDYKKDIPEALKYLNDLVCQKKLVLPFDWSIGLDQCPNALRKLLTGGNIGKTAVKVYRDNDPMTIRPKL